MKKFPVVLTVALVLFTACKKQDNDGKIIFLLGDVTVNNLPAELNQVIKPGTEIKTAKDSVCEVIFADKNIIRISPSSAAVLNISKTVNDIYIKTGAVLSVMKKLTKEGFKVNTPTAIASIRGTTFYVNVENPRSTYLCDCNGIIKVQDKNNKVERQLSANHHKGVRITKKGGSIKITNAGMKYHTDADLEKLANKIDEVIDWNIIDGE